MPLNLNQVAPDPVYSNLAIASSQSGPFIGDQIMPVVPVARDEFWYFKYDDAHLVDNTATERAIGAGANKVSFSQSRVTASTSRHSLQMDLPAEYLAQSPNPAILQNHRVLVVQNLIRIDIEKRIRAAIQAVNQSTSPSIKWDASSGVTIKANIDANKALFKARYGMLPNTMVIPYDVAVVMSNDSDIKARDKRTTDDQLRSGALPPVLFEMNVLIAGAVTKASSAAALAEIWADDEVDLLYVDNNISIDPGTVTFGAQFRAPARGGLNWAAYTYPDPDQTTNKDWYAVEVNQTEKVINPGCVQRITNVLT